MNKKEHMLDDSPLTKEKLSELKKNAAEMLKEFESVDKQEKKASSASTAGAMKV